jgi:AP endonuclease 1
VAPLDADLSHAEHYKRQVMKGARPDEEHVGQPGCTPAERAQFARILAAGDAVDLYRTLHPVSGDGSRKRELSEPLFSWRGGEGKHYGRGMRIDHFVGSKALVERVETVRNLGSGSERDGFLGSDHCPVLLVLRPVEGTAEKAGTVEKNKERG